jgi:hypothetical protein
LASTLWEWRGIWRWFMGFAFTCAAFWRLAVEFEVVIFVLSFAFTDL